MEEYLGKATEIKAALVKSRPGRQLFEKAPEFFKATTAADPRVEQARAGSFEDQLEVALDLKDYGNGLFKDECYERALQSYTRAISVFLWFDRGVDKAAEDIPLRNSTEELRNPEDKEQASNLLCALFNNAAASLMKLDKPREAVYACSKALEFDADNIKALYRRAEAQAAIGTTTSLAAAIHDLQAAAKLEPNNKSIREALEKYNEELLDNNRQQKGIYSKMFQKGLYEDSAKEERKNGKVSEADMHEEADKAFKQMQRNAARTRVLEQIKADRQAKPSTTWLGAIARLPWWVVLLLGLHFCYRLYKLWSIPLQRASSRPAEAARDLESITETIAQAVNKLEL